MIYQYTQILALNKIANNDNNDNAGIKGFYSIKGGTQLDDSLYQVYNALAGVQILSNSCSLGENLAKSCVGAPWRIGAPTRGNPGSTTALLIPLG